MKGGLWGDPYLPALRSSTSESISFSFHVCHNLGRKCFFVPNANRFVPWDPELGYKQELRCTRVRNPGDGYFYCLFQNPWYGKISMKDTIFFSFSPFPPYLIPPGCIKTQVEQMLCSLGLRCARDYFPKAKLDYSKK